MEKQSSFAQEFFRDFLALGSWVFYILVLARALIEPYRPFADQVIIAGVIILLFEFTKKTDTYVARVLPLVYFTIIFYSSTIFTTFAIVVGLGVILASIHHNKTPKKLALGLLLGVIATTLSYYATTLY